MARSKVAHEQSSCFVASALGREQNYSDTDKTGTLGQILHMNSSTSGLAPAISPPSSSPKLHSHKFLWGPSSSHKTITDWQSLALKSNQKIWSYLCFSQPVGFSWWIGLRIQLALSQVSASVTVARSDSRSAHMAALHLSPSFFILCLGTVSRSFFSHEQKEFIKGFSFKKGTSVQALRPSGKPAAVVQICCADICLRVPTSKDQPQMWRHFNLKRDCRKYFSCNCQWSSTCLAKFSIRLLARFSSPHGRHPQFNYNS